jgi:hypothetical protein
MLSASIVVHGASTISVIPGIAIATIRIGISIVAIRTNGTYFIISSCIWISYYGWSVAVIGIAVNLSATYWSFRITFITVAGLGKATTGKYQHQAKHYCYKRKIESFHFY